MMYISNVLANSNLILNHPHIRWNPEWCVAAPSSLASLVSF